MNSQGNLIPEPTFFSNISKEEKKARRFVKRMIIDILNVDFPFFRRAQNLAPYSQAQIDLFIRRNNEDLNNVIIDTIKEYVFHGTLDDVYTLTQNRLRDILDERIEDFYETDTGLKYGNYNYEPMPQAINYNVLDKDIVFNFDDIVNTDNLKTISRPLILNNIMMDEQARIKEYARQVFIGVITNHLTVKKQKDKSIPYTQEEINIYIKNHEASLDNAVDLTYKIYGTMAEISAASADDLNDLLYTYMWQLDSLTFDIMPEEEKLARRHLRQLFLNTITGYLTTDRQYRRQVPYSQEQIKSFISENKSDLNDHVNLSINHYKKYKTLSEIFLLTQSDGERWLFEICPQIYNRTLLLK